MNRLIVTGCSFTNYLPPTWPWFLAEKFDETYNFGKPGAGNEYIFHSLIDADSLLKFNSNDVIIVMWSGFFRIDRSTNEEGWKTKGDMINWPKEEYLYFSSQFSNDFLVKRSINFILSTYRYLKEKKLNFFFGSMGSLKEDNNFVNLLDEIYDDGHFVIEDVTKLFLRKNRDRTTDIKWSHPSPVEHYEIAKLFANKINLELNSSFNFEMFMNTIGSEENYQRMIVNNSLHLQNRITNEINLPFGNSHQVKLHSLSLKNLEKYIIFGV